MVSPRDASELRQSRKTFQGLADPTKKQYCAQAHPQLLRGPQGRIGLTLALESLHRSSLSLIPPGILYQHAGSQQIWDRRVRPRPVWRMDHYSQGRPLTLAKSSLGPSLSVSIRSQGRRQEGPHGASLVLAPNLPFDKPLLPHGGEGDPGEASRIKLPPYRRKHQEWGRNVPTTHPC